METFQYQENMMDLKYEGHRLNMKQEEAEK